LILLVDVDWLLFPEPPIGTQKCVPYFFCPISKNVPFRGLKKGVRSSMAPHSNQLDSFSIGSIGHFCYTLMHVQHACQIRPRTATPDNIGCIAAHVNNWALDRVNLKYSIHLNITFFFIGQDTSSKQPSAIAEFSQHHINSRALFFFTRRILMQGVQHSTQKHHCHNKQIHNIYNMNTTRDKIQKHAHRESK